MKIYLLSAVILFLHYSSYSMVRTVSNNPNIPAQFATFDAAYLPSVNGDTIYVHGSPTQYTVVGSIAKSITIIGPGFNPEKQYKLPATFFGGINISVSNVSLFGIYDASGIGFNPAALNIRISRCYLSILTLTASSTGFMIDGCCFPVGSTFYINGQNNTITNCIIYSLFTQNAAPKNWTIDHNTILAGTDFQYLTNSWISNNILAGPFAVTANNNSYFNNYHPFTVLPGAGNTGSGNANGTPAYLDYVPARPFLFWNNFNLTGASVGNNAATDGTDVGACGGGNPFASEGEVKTLPIIREMDILSPVVPSPGNVNVHIRATQPK